MQELCELWGIGGFEGRYREMWWANTNVEREDGQWILTYPVDFGPMIKEAAVKLL